jgi:thioesterase domain-containing protein/acyl carrier protein
MAVCPIGVPGDLYIGGECTASGYINEVELSARKFPANPFTAGENMYFTGDIARWYEDGNMEFLGRVDKQVKIRGYRIELAEIESRLLEHPRVKQVIVEARKSKGAGAGKSLCAYLVSDGPVPQSELKDFLARELPDYMQPSYFVYLDRFPVTANGKLDRAALPEPDPAGADAGQYAPPTNGHEELLVTLWSKVLGINPELVGIDSNFFALGGQSLKATVLIANIQDHFQVGLPLVEVFRNPTIRQLAARIGREGGTHAAVPDEHLVLLEKGTEDALNLFFLHDGTGEVEGYIEFCDQLEGNYNCWGIRTDRIENHTPRDWDLKQLASTYIGAMRKIQPRGPYYITGWSLGGTTAVEITRQLEQAGDSAALLALIDSPPPQSTSRENVPVFDLESEFQWIQEHFTSEQMDELRPAISHMDQFWPAIVAYLENSNIDLEVIRSVVRQYGGQALPNYHRLGISQLIYYLNAGRSLSRARQRYSITQTLSTPAHYFAARESAAIDHRGWQAYFDKPVTFHTLEGDHFSIFTQPGVVDFARRFEQLIHP